MTTKILNQAQHKHVAAVHLCSTGSMTKDGEPVGKVLNFTSNSKLMVGRLAKDFGQCHCTQKHAGLTNVDQKLFSTMGIELFRLFVVLWTH